MFLYFDIISRFCIQRKFLEVIMHLSSTNITSKTKAQNQKNVYFFSVSQRKMGKMIMNCFLWDGCLMKVWQDLLLNAFTNAKASE